MMEDDTLVETNEKLNTEQQPEQAVQEITEKETEAQKSPKKISAGAAAGIGAAAGAAGAAAAAIPFFAFGGDTEERIITPPSNDGQDINSGEHVPEVSDLPVATGVTDDMTFSEAFAAARQEVGAGGMFYYHGHAYGTYYENEWNNMSGDDKADYWASVHHTHAEYVHEHPEVVSIHRQTPPKEEIVTQYTLEDIQDANLSVTLQVDANHNDKPDLLVDVDDDGVGDVVLLDVEMDDEGRILSVADAREGKYELALDDEDDNETPEMEDNDQNIIDEMPNDEMVDAGDQEIAYNPDYDYSANTDLDPNAFIDNNMDTLDMV